MNRVRLNLAVEPRQWARFHLRIQDSQAFDWRTRTIFRPNRNTLESTLGFVEFGRPGGGWLLQAGRQEIVVGDERLAGADSVWDPSGLAFDAVRFSTTVRGVIVQAFSGFRVRREPDRLDATDTANRLSGIDLQFAPRAPLKMLVQPYVLWKHARNSTNHRLCRGGRDIITPGVRLTGLLPAALDYNLELVAGRGRAVGDRVASWAGHWEAGWRPLGPESGPRLSFEYDFASGDSNPDDTRHGTFDDLYPAGYNSHGMIDPFAWRNLRQTGTGATVPISPRWSAGGLWRSYWLATRTDGLYTDSDHYTFRDPLARSSHIGQHLFVSAQFQATKAWRISAGAGQLLPGRYLRDAGQSSSWFTAHLLSEITF